MSETQPLQLRVLEAYTRDVGRGVARIDYDTMDKLNASTGDVLEIHGENRTTVGKCLPLYPSDEGKGIARLDGLMRNNIGIAIGGTVIINKVDAMPAQKVIIKPLMSIPPIDTGYLADALENVPIIKGDNIMVPYFGGRLTFQVIYCEPKDKPLIIQQTTTFTISNAEVTQPRKIDLTTNEHLILKKILRGAVCTSMDSRIITLQVTNLNIDSSEFEILSKKFT